MKKGLMVLPLLITILMLGSCGNKNGSGSFKKSPPDTANITAIFVGYEFDGVWQGPATRITRDSFMFNYVDKDSMTAQKQWVRDSIYIAQVPVRIDSARAKKFNVPLLDSNGKQNVIRVPIWIHKDYVRSGWDNADSASKELEKYIIKR